MTPRPYQGGIYRPIVRCEQRAPRTSTLRALTLSSTLSLSHGSLGVYASGVSQTILEPFVYATTSEQFGIFVTMAAVAAAASASSAVAVGEPRGDLEVGLRRCARRPDRPRLAAAEGRPWRPRRARAGVGVRPLARTSRLGRRRMVSVASAASRSVRMWGPVRRRRGADGRLGAGGRW